jgi:hypothetical protein
MRSVAILVIAFLLASVPCVAACTAAACDEIAQQVERAKLPPCHQQPSSKHSQRSQHSQPQPCDHQKTAVSPDQALAQLEFAGILQAAPSVLMSPALPVFLPTVVDSTANPHPSRTSFAILRI